MDIKILRRFLGWCTLIDYVILMLWFVLFVFARSWLVGISGGWYGISESTVIAMSLGGIGLFKLGVLMFNLVPYAALRIVSR